jgi:hypothetical protein
VRGSRNDTKPIANFIITKISPNIFSYILLSTKTTKGRSISNMNLVTEDFQKNHVDMKEKIDLYKRGILVKKWLQRGIMWEGAKINLSKQDAQFLGQCIFYMVKEDSEFHVAIPMEATLYQVELIEKVFKELHA